MRVSWRVDGVDCTVTYNTAYFIAPHDGYDSFLEWLLNSLAIDGCRAITVSAE